MAFTPSSLNTYVTISRPFILFAFWQTHHHGTGIDEIIESVQA